MLDQAMLDRLKSKMEDLKGQMITYQAQIDGIYSQHDHEKSKELVESMKTEYCFEEFKDGDAFKPEYWNHMSKLINNNTRERLKNEKEKTN